MPKEKHPFESLKNFIPEESFDGVMHYILKYNVLLTITKNRKSILGNYRAPHGNQGHRISVNGSLNKYAFLVTLLHEIAHLVTFEKHHRQVQPHGREWKYEFGLVLQPFVESQIFPDDIKLALVKTMHSAAASTCAEPALTKVLNKYDETKTGITYVDEIPINSLFKIRGGGIYRKGEKRRTRFICTEIKTGKKYLFSGVHEVKLVEIED